MTNILTPNEASNYLRIDPSDPTLLMLLPAIDQFVQRGTGRNWTADNPISPLAKAAAGMLLVQWYDNPAMIGDNQIMPYGLTAVLTQLEAEALKYRMYTFYGRDGVGSITLPIAMVGDQVLQLVGIYGISGDQTDLFEATISKDYQIQQLSGNDLSEMLFSVVLKNPKDDVLP